MVKWAFWLVLLLPPLLMMGTCAGVGQFVFSEDEEVAGGALMFGLNALNLLWTVWLVGIPVLGILLLLTRGRLLVIEHPSPITKPPQPTA